MLVLLGLVFTLARVPSAYLDTGGAHVPLTVSSWCLRARCGAPIAASRHVATVRKGALVRCVFAFRPAQVTVSVGGIAVRTTTSGREAEWRATRGGGVAITASAPSVWVTYVGRMRLG